MTTTTNSGSVSMSYQAPQTIQAVIDELERIIETSIRSGARIGYFAALYQRVTISVKRALIAGNVFQDNARMERLDVIFADRFLAAWHQHQQGQTPSAPWAVTFAQLDDPELLIVQHLGLAMNAHIDLDLGIAAAELMDGQPLDALHTDFKTINDILARLIGIVQVQLAQLSPRFANIERVAPVLENKMFGKVLDLLRDGAWLFAEQVHQASGDERAAIIDRRARLAAEVGRSLADPGWLVEQAEEWIGAKESKDVAYNIQVLGE